MHHNVQSFIQVIDKELRSEQKEAIMETVKIQSDEDFCKSIETLAFNGLTQQTNSSEASSATSDAMPIEIQIKEEKASKIKTTNCPTEE